MDTLPEPPRPKKYKVLSIESGIPKSMIYDYICLPPLADHEFKKKINYKRLVRVADNITNELFRVFLSINQDQILQIITNVKNKLEHWLKFKYMNKYMLSNIAFVYLYKEIHKICDTSSLESAISIFEDNCIGKHKKDIQMWIAVCFDSIWSYVLHDGTVAPGLHNRHMLIKLIDINPIKYIDTVDSLYD